MTDEVQIIEFKGDVAWGKTLTAKLDMTPKSRYWLKLRVEALDDKAFFVPSLGHVCVEHLTISTVDNSFKWVDSPCPFFDTSDNFQTVDSLINNARSEQLFYVPVFGHWELGRCNVTLTLRDMDELVILPDKLTKVSGGKLLEICFMKE